MHSSSAIARSKTLAIAGGGSYQISPPQPGSALCLCDWFAAKEKLGLEMSRKLIAYKFSCDFRLHHHGLLLG